MKRGPFERGSGVEDVLILGSLLIIIFFFILPGAYPSFIGNNGSSGSRGEDAPSAYAGLITLSKGSASSAEEASEEYVMVANKSTIPITITDWRLSGNSGEATLPKGYRTAVSQGSIRLDTVVLAPGESALVSTGPVDSRVSDSVGSGDKLWWVYLGRGYEMWDTRYETISLYDRLGKLVDSISY